MTCPRCGALLLFPDVDDGVSRDSLCAMCGHITHLTRTGAVYQPPTELDQEDRLPHHGPQHRNEYNVSRHYRDGCAVHQQCATCPFAVCVVGDREAYESARKEQRRRQWFGNKPLEQVTDEDVRTVAEAEGIGERTVFRRLATLRQARQ